MKIVFELPFYSPTVGGIVETIKLADYIDADVRFQRKSNHTFVSEYPITHSFGLPDRTFPKCDVCITYSDNPYIDQLCALPQVGKVIVYFLSYGMAIERERKCAFHKKVTAICSTKKIEDAIRKEGGKVTRVGFALDMSGFWDLGEKREERLAIYYHPMESKRYKDAVDIANAMYANGYINSVASFGTDEGYKKHKHPICTTNHVANADKKQIRDLFNQCQIFVNPSRSEGLNLTPIEATLCGCPSVIVDGAIGELFIDGKTCFIAEPNFNDIYNSSVELLKERELFADYFKDNMKELMKEYTYANVINNIYDVL